MRGGTAVDVPVQLMSAPESPARDVLTLDDTAILRGLQLSRINPAVINEMNLPLGATGVVVTNPGPIAVRVGLRRGDVIEAVSGQSIETPYDFQDTLKAAGRSVRLDVMRGVRRVQLRFRL